VGKKNRISGQPGGFDREPVPGPLHSGRVNFDRAVPGSGWHLCEEFEPGRWFCWSGPETESLLRVRLGKTKNRMVRVRILTALVDPASVKIQINDQPVELEVLPEEPGWILQGPVPQGTVSGKRESVIRLSTERTVVPREVDPDSTDLRPLGVAVAWIELERVRRKPTVAFGVDDRPLSRVILRALDRSARWTADPPVRWRSVANATRKVLRPPYRAVRRLLGAGPAPNAGQPSASPLPGETPQTISYAQNAEDVVLSRTFAAVENGFYVDIGAADPRADSVTKLFYDRGWHGINVETQRNFFQALQRARPRDINLNLAVSDTTGSLAFYEVPARPGRSTLTSRLAEFYRTAGYEIEEGVVQVVTLRDVCAQHAPSRFEFLKIDVEGHEEAVLRGGDWDAFRPAVVVIEATDSAAWEHILLEARYREVLFDGVNRFYLADECPHLHNQLKTPASVIDNYVPYVYQDLLAAARAKR